MTTAQAVERLHQRAERFFCPRIFPDIIDLLEGRAGKPALQLVDKDSDYRGPFSTENCPDIREIARSCVSPEVESTVIVGPAQSYKTTILIGVAGYTIEVDPGGLAWVFGSAPVARMFSQKRFQGTVDATPWLAGKKPADPNDYKDLELGFKTCTVRFAGANSPGNLATFPYRRVIGDEVDKYPQRVKKEAGTLDLLTLRTEQVARFNHIFASTPTIPTGTIWQAALRGDCRRYHVPCPHCSKLFVQKLEHLKWDNTKTATGAADFRTIARTAHLECPHCQGEIWEHHRRDMLHAGQWIPDPIEEADARRAEYDLIADPGRRSYFRSCFNVLHPNRTFAKIAVKHVKAGRDPSARQNFTNGELAEVFEEAAERVDAKVIQDRAESYLSEDEPRADGTPLPYPLPTPLLPHACPVLVLVAGVDVQEDRLECEIVAYGPGEETWGVQYSIITGKPTSRDTWDRLDQLLARPWQHPLGYVLTPACVGVDTGHETEEVYKYVARCVRAGRKVIAVKGSSGGYGEPALFRPQKSGVKEVHLWMVGTTTMKEHVYSRLRVTEPGPGCMHFPRNPRRGYDAAFFRGLTAERRIKKRAGNRVVVKYVNPTRKPNEALDIRGYAHGAFIHLAPDFEGLAKKVQAMTEPPPPPPPPAPTPAQQSLVEAAAVAVASFDMETGAIIRPAVSAPVLPLPIPDAVAPPAPNTYRVPAEQPAPAKLFRSPMRVRRNFATNW